MLSMVKMSLKREIGSHALNTHGNYIVDHRKAWKDHGILFSIFVGTLIMINVFQAICELFKRSLQTLMDDFAPLSKDIAELLVQMYQTIPHTAILDLTKQVGLLHIKL